MSTSKPAVKKPASKPAAPKAPAAKPAKPAKSKAVPDEDDEGRGGTDIVRRNGEGFSVNRGVSPAALRGELAAQ